VVFLKRPLKSLEKGCRKVLKKAVEEPWKDVHMAYNPELKLPGFLHPPTVVLVTTFSTYPLLISAFFIFSEFWPNVG
jgi:hypothetical protein